MHTLRDNYGPDAAVWRYDPIVITPGMPGEWHVANFRRLAEALRGTTNEVVISFVDIGCYEHVQERMAHVKWSELAVEKKTAMASQLASIAKQYGMQLTMCCEPSMQPKGTRPSHCVDAERFARLVLHPIKAAHGGSRPGCRCFANRDIGDYETCMHGCIYCYATDDHALNKTFHAVHDAGAEILIPLAEGSDKERITQKTQPRRNMADIAGPKHQAQSAEWVQVSLLEDLGIND
jgi:hypothetical protein